MMRWDQSSLLTATIPDTDSNLLFYGKEETGWAGSSISQVLLNAMGFSGKNTGAMPSSRGSSGGWVRTSHVCSLKKLRGKIHSD